MLSRDEEARAKRLTRARVDRGYQSVEGAAKALGLTASTWRAHENGTRSITKSAAARYASALGIQFEWLWTGHGELNDSPSPALKPNVVLEPQPIQQGWRQMPLYGRVYGGNSNGVIIEDDGTERVDRPKSLENIDSAYALEVIGDSMAERYTPGEIVHVNPQRAYHRGSYVVIQVEKPTGERCGYIKRFVAQTRDEVVVEQLNPAMEIRFDADEVRAIHLVVGTAIR